MLLGDGFLRNVYSLFDFGNWTAVGTTNPFMQILSVSDQQLPGVTEFDAIFGSDHGPRAGVDGV